MPGHGNHVNLILHVVGLAASTMPSLPFAERLLMRAQFFLIARMREEGRGISEKIGQSERHPVQRLKKVGERLEC